MRLVAAEPRLIDGQATVLAQRQAILVTKIDRTMVLLQGIDAMEAYPAG